MKNEKLNWIVVLTRNNLHLTQKAVESFRAQDIGNVRVLAVDNGSTDSTPQFLATQRDITTIFNRPANSVAGGWNQALRWLFEPKWANGTTPLPPMAEYALVVNNDVLLHKSTYRWLVEDGGLFITAVGSRDPEKIQQVDPPDPAKKRPHPDFSAYLIRREVVQRVGYFDEGYAVAFYEDNDMHLRLHQAGIRAEALELPFLHYGSMTIKNSTPQERKRITDAAAVNKEYFKRKFGFYSGTPEYYAAFGHGEPQPESI